MKNMTTQFPGEESNGLAEPSSHSGNDPFDLSRLRLSQDFEATTRTSKLLTTVPVRRPDPQTFFRVHPNDAYQMETAVLEHHEDRETYLVDSSLWPQIRSEIIPKVLYTAITRQDTLFIWPVRLEASDGRLDTWNRSAHLAAREAKKGWVRMTSNRERGAYDVLLPEAHYPDPEWPRMTFEEILRIAFRDHFIRDLDHPVIKRLQGRH